MQHLRRNLRKESLLIFQTQKLHNQSLCTIQLRKERLLMMKLSKRTKMQLLIMISLKLNNPNKMEHLNLTKRYLIYSLSTNKLSLETNLKKKMLNLMKEREVEEDHLLRSQYLKTLMSMQNQKLKCNRREEDLRKISIMIKTITGSRKTQVQRKV